MAVRVDVRSSLASDEEVIHEQSPDTRVWLLGKFPELIVVAVCAFIAGSAASVQVTTVAVVGIVVVAVGIASGYLERRSTRYVITQYRVIRFSGVMRRDHEWMQWKKVTDVSMRRSIIDRLGRTATIKIQSANEASGFKEMTDLANPMQFAQIVVDLVNATDKKVRVAVRHD